MICLAEGSRLNSLGITRQELWAQDWELHPLWLHPESHCDCTLTAAWKPCAAPQKSPGPSLSEPYTLNPERGVEGTRSTTEAKRTWSRLVSLNP